ncbi:MAG: 3-oxoacyl-[acyl-carrier-protein] synthase III C-terminal domain-containing protein [Elusimicrobia bacterium]|nr:3-oxoacyl-[acyl-carrier-protein] synthase III C-terminal domain-containing protein [Elusimicrobiota bacterium]
MAWVLSVGTAVPEARYSQKTIRSHCEAAFKGTEAGGREDLFDRAGVETRGLVEAPEYYFADIPFARRNADYFPHAERLARRALQDALEQAGVAIEELTHLFSVTTTGLMTPSLDAHLAQALPFRRTIKRTPLFGVGCAGGAVALSRAFEYLRGHPEETVAVLSVELCSLTFLPKDGTMTQLVAAAIFGDGAACAILCGTKSPAAGRAKLGFVDNESVLIPDSLHVMGWDFGADGMRLVLSTDAPAIVERSLEDALSPLLARHGVCVDELSPLILHPGSARILDACERAMGLPDGAAALSRAFLKRHGNLSSASVLFILKDALAQPKIAAPWGLLAALGPGFALEALLIRNA